MTTEYEKLEKAEAKRRIAHILKEMSRYSNRLLVHGPAAADCPAILDEFTFMDFARLADFAGVSYTFDVVKSSPLESLARGTFIED